jgi:LEA14-like dessication related protein
VSKRSRKKAGVIILSILLLPGLLAFLLFYNRQRFSPKVEDVTYLKLDFGKDTTLVYAGLRVQNQAFLPLIIDSINYEVRNKNAMLGEGNQLVKKRLPASGSKQLDFRFSLNKKQYQKFRELQKNQDSLSLDIQLKVYIDPPLLNQQVITINRTISLAKPKAPAIKIDSLVVKNFSPDAGYTFQLNLNTKNMNLPDLKIEDLNYQICFSDSLLIAGKIDSTFRINEGAKSVTVPIHLKTSEMIALLRLKLSKQNKWPYDAKATATIKTSHPLFENTKLSLEKSGIIDARKIGKNSLAKPSIKQLKSLQLILKPKYSYLEAELLINNPTTLPLYLDSARFIVRHKGKIMAYGGKDYEKVFQAKGNTQLPLQLNINNNHYKQIMAQAHENDKLLLDTEVLLYYNLKDSKPQLISVKKKISFPVMKGPGFKVKDIGIKQLDPKQGAQLFVKLEIQNKSLRQLQLDDLKYQVVVDKQIEISGQTSQLIKLNSGTSEIEIPVDLSATNVNLLSKGLLTGKESWDYTFNGTATVSVVNSILQQTEVNLHTQGVFNINSKGTPDYMPEISKIDTLFATIHYDTAWVRMYAAIYNTLPAAVNITQLEVDVIHEKDTIGRTEEVLNTSLIPNTNTFAWHTLGIKFSDWERHVKHHQGEDSMLLSLPVTLTFELGNLGKQQVLINMDTRIPTPATPATLLGKLLFRSFSFRTGLNFDAPITVQNSNSEGLTIKNIDYQVTLENGVDICGKVNRTYKFPIGSSEVMVPVNLSVWEAIKLFTRRMFGPSQINYKINATAQLRTDNPKLSDVYIIFENYDQGNLKEKKTGK